MDNDASDTSAHRPGDCELTILLPCLNEAETVGTCVAKAKSYLEAAHVDGEVLVADNGSEDGSQAIAVRRGARVIEVKRRGYGSALLGGIAAARGKYVIIGDSDNSYDFSSLELFIDKLRDDYELVMGNRFEGGIAPGAMPLLHRHLGNPLLSWIGRLFFKCPIGDFHCGLRGFNRESTGRLNLTTTGMEFASELIVKATLQRLRIAEVPTTLSPAGRSRPPHLRTWRDGWRHLRFLLLFSPRWLFLYPGALLMLAGLASMIWLLPGPRRVGGVTIDVHTLVYSGAAIVCGFQAVTFSLLAKVFAINAGLMPRDARLDRLSDVISLEGGVAAGLVLLVGGLATSGYALGVWESVSFGPLDPVSSMRIVIPGATAMVLGLQVIFVGFFLGVLGLDRR